MKTYVAAVDCGTTVVKAGIFDLQGNTEGIISEYCPCHKSRNGRIENDPDIMTEAVFSCLKRAVRQSRTNPSAIESLAITNQRATVICTDNKGRALSNAISWQDMGGVNHIKKLQRKIKDKRYYSITGLPNNPVFSLAKILCIRENDSALFKKTERFVLVHDFLLKKLGCDDFYCDWANASLTGMMNISKFQWSTEILGLAGINKNKLPTLVAPGKVVGRLSREASHKTGLVEGTPLVSGAGDQQCAGIGAGAVSSGIAGINLGTVAVPICFSGKVLKDRLMRVTCCSYAVPGKWEIEGLQTCAGSGLKWIYRIFFRNKSFSRKYFETVTNVEPGANGITFLPYLNGASAPYWNPKATAKLIGLKSIHSGAEIVRAVMEGISMETRQIIDVFTSLGLQIEDIRLSGGYSGIDAWNQIQADIQGRPVSVMKNLQSSLLGAAILAAHGINAFPSVEEGSKRMVKIRKTYIPSKGNKSSYEEIYKNYCKISADHVKSYN
ncbi:MAG: FGGY family carbohydrate kinase [Kiritimatiellae bacterium]|nr:FGGY family carbohydrate kinase [Kiritimatiellia bacterium]MDD5520290.1 FGGY family carbohydrate kinase [Kiritimatiellia bacterium]